MNKIVLPGNSMLLLSPVRAIAALLIHLTGLLGSCHLSRPLTICAQFLNPELQFCDLCDFELLLFAGSANGNRENRDIGSLTSCHLVSSLVWKKVA